MDSRLPPELNQRWTAVRPPRGRQLMLFARNFVKHPKMLGSVIPSSRFLIRQVLDQVDWRGVRLAVEYGPGVGNFTAEALSRMRPDARLVAIEMNPDFVPFLRGALPDPRLEVVQGSALEVGATLQRLGLGRADCVISGIPFSTMAAPVRESILRQTREILAPDGVFLVYQFSPGVAAHLERVFDHVEKGFEPRNLLPAHWYRCRTASPAAGAAG